ncbi:DUF4335 domain-containing protein [Leptolyngbya cf. ectocarpi LEGE 11479]|uniref:DUF4335 domain-containing protein n=1 Tax=Leptolyngbya cf. ectocarpi LEGE 11479 TaxID=1828722 RepID=A0A928X0V6_LEPEC|nr:DUF4335 domain-containing protein [Leptolyngbya ectocarpi]MBE9065479.1 DUF4335 domain-containing protein [Leptolyngbya cf. ectocarpi LEGE 11479]
MSSVLSIDTQRYQSGSYTLEVTAHQSPLSQWSDRPVVRQLRFSLWSEQQRLVTGDQLQLVTLSDTIESYVQRHLSQQAWPQSHRLTLLDHDVELSHLQLFDLAEVLNSYGQCHITLPKAPAKRRRQWWTGSAVASLLVAVGVTAVYLQYRPAAFDQMETTQAPEAVFENKAGSSVAPDAAPEILSEEESAPPADSVAPPAARPTPEIASDSSATENRPENQRLSSPTSETTGDAPVAPATSPDPAADFTEPSAPDPAADFTEPSADKFATAQEQLEQDTAPAETNVLPEAAPAAPAPEAVEESAESDRSSAGAIANERPEAAARIRQPEREASDSEILDAIATQLTPYQPKDASYPLVYQLEISPGGRILTQVPVSANAPALDLSDVMIEPSPGRVLTIEVVYTGTGSLTVREIE